jgi:glycosyltransferase involved in cell wall biosynthesis
MDTSVSIIIPSFNRAGLVEACIRSLLASGLPDLEIVVADDGSTDHTEAVVRRFGQPVTYVRQANAGPAAARNRGAATSRGRYLTFLDSDDAWRPGVATRLVGQLDRHPEIDLVFADTQMGNPLSGYVSFIQEYGGDWFWNAPRQIIEPGLDELERWFFFQRLARRNVMFLGSLLVRREAFLASGEFDPNLRGAADWEFFMRAATSLRVAFSSGEALATYEKHEEGMSTDTDHMEKEFALALEGVLSKCELPEDIRSYVSARLREQLFGWAWHAYDQGRLTIARERLQWVVRTGLAGPREWAYLAATYLPKPILDALRKAKTTRQDLRSESGGV